MKFELSPLAGQELDEWILGRLSSIRRRCTEKRGLLVVSSEGGLLVESSSAKKIAERLNISGELEKALCPNTAGSLVSRVLGGEEIDCYPMKGCDTQVLLCATPLVRGEAVVAAVIRLSEVSSK